MKSIEPTLPDTAISSVRRSRSEQKRGPLLSARSSLANGEWFGIMASRERKVIYEVIDDSTIRSLLTRDLCSSSSDEDGVTGPVSAIAADNYEPACRRNDVVRSTSTSPDEERVTVPGCRDSSSDEERVTAPGCRDPSSDKKRVTVPGCRDSSSDEERVPGCRGPSSDEERVPGCRDPSRNNRLSPTSDRSRPVDQPTGQDMSSRRDSNPFSFKAFLKNGTQQTNYHNTGARPKIYSFPTSCPGNVFDKDNAGSVYSARNPTELPDFVQDHLVIEQCYLNHEAAQPVLPDVDNLPDFALNSVEQRQSRLRNETKKNDSEIFGDDLRSFDLTDMLHKNSTHRDHSASNAMHSNHLDLPVFGDRLEENAPYLPRPEHRGFPFDLPLPFAESNLNGNATTRDGILPGSEASVHKSLPDFLSDGPIYNRSADSEPDGANMTESTERRLLLENERLHQQLETVRRQISEKTERIRSLEAELLSKREIEHEETSHLEKAMDQLENNLIYSKRNTKRAVNSETFTITRLKKKIKALTEEISLLRLENDKLRANTSTAGQGESNIGVKKNRTVRRLSRDLFAAASSAEVSLRQLMSGVDNLRVLASTLENMDRIEDWTKDFLPDSDEENAAGPAV